MHRALSLSPPLFLSPFSLPHLSLFLYLSLLPTRAYTHTPMRIAVGVYSVTALFKNNSSLRSEIAYPKDLKSKYFAIKANFTIIMKNYT
jgi:hypothetical protein